MWRQDRNCGSFSGTVLRYKFDSTLPSATEPSRRRVQQGWSSLEGQPGR